MKKPSESGRSIVEIIAILVLMMLLVLTGLWGFKHAVLSARVHTMSKDLSTAVTERRYEIARSGTSKPHKLTTKVGSTEMTIQNRTEGERDFFVTISNMTPETCEEMKKYNVFKPRALGKNGDTSTYTTNFDEINCAEITSLDFYFDPSDGGGSDGNGGGGNGGGGAGGGDDNPLGGNCDGKTCPTCQKCDAMTGQCVNENDGVYIEECGICQNGEPVQDGEDTDCQTCNHTTWKWDYKDKGTATTNPCKLCGEKGVIEPKENANIDICYQCVDGEKVARTDTFSCGNTCCKNGYLCLGEEGHKQCSVNKPSDCNDCQTFNTTTGKCKDKTDACHYCDTTNNSWRWLEGKTNYTTCGNQCCEFGCDETDNTKCRAMNCSFGTQTYAHNATVGNCGICHNGVIEPKDSTDVCHVCDATTSWNLTLKEKGKETVCGEQCCQKCDPNNPNQCAPVQECMMWDSESETYVADTSTETCCKKHGKIWNKTKQICNTGCEEGENLCSSPQGKWCCATGCGETYETCCSKGTCCADRHTPYKEGSTTKCCNGKYAKIDGREACCPSGQTPYGIYYSDGTLANISCCSGNVSKVNVDGKQQEICCSAGSTPYCKHYNNDGICNSFSCCEKGGEVKSITYSGKKKDVCCSMSGRSYNWTLYMNGITEDGYPNATCCSGSFSHPTLTAGGVTVTSCCLPGESIYCGTYNSNGTCAAAACCTSGRTYCSTYNTDGSCRDTRCCYGNLQTLTVGGTAFKQCCSPGESIYCSDFKEDGTCTSADCCSGNSYYCYSYHTNGQCQYKECCSGGNVYCASYDDGGKCVSQRCCYTNSKIIKANIDGKNYEVCCAKTATTLYCSQYSRYGSSKGKCVEAACCAGTAYCYKYDMNEKCLGEACCPTGAKVYCNKYENGKCMEKSCGADCKAIKTYDDGTFKQDVCCKTATGTPQCTKWNGTTCIQAACI